MPNFETAINTVLAIPVIAYLAVSAALCVTHSDYVSPCNTMNSNIKRDDSSTSHLYSLIKHGLGWPFQFYRHVTLEDMPLTHFILASDCKWAGQPPPDARLFVKATSEACPEGTLPYKSGRCQIPARARTGDAEPSYQRPPAANDWWSCGEGWIASPGIGPAICTLPSIRKTAGQQCPAGFVSYQPNGDIKPSDEVCRLAR